MRQAWKGWKLLWGSIPARRRIIIKVVTLMWLNTAWINGLHTWVIIEHSRRSEICFAVGALASSGYLFLIGMKFIKHGRRMLVSDQGLDMAEDMEDPTDEGNEKE